MAISSQRPVPRAGVLDIDPYVPGKSKASGGGRLFKLSSNETPFGPSPAAIVALLGLEGCEQFLLLAHLGLQLIAQSCCLPNHVGLFGLCGCNLSSQKSKIGLLALHLRQNVVCIGRQGLQIVGTVDELTG